MKKAQGMSLKVVIIAALALIVLVVLALIFTGKVKFFSGTASDTTSQYAGRNCEVPGTMNECMGEDECERRGGSWTEAPDGGYEDCGWQGCCSL